MFDLSIIIPAYNAENFIFRCLNSIAESINIDNYEIIIVDDGSTDRTVEFAQYYIRDNKSENITIIQQKNSRQGAARNRGLELAEGKYVMFVDVDDYLNPIDFENLYNTAIHYSLDILHYSINVLDKAGNNIACLESQFEEGRIYSGIEVVTMNYLIGSVCGAIFKKNFIDRLNLRFKENIIHEDAEFMLRLLPKAKRIMFSHSRLYSYCWNEGSTDRATSMDRLIISMKSDIIIAKSYMETADSNDESPVSAYYYKKANSLITSLLFSLISKYKAIPIAKKLQIIDFAQKNDVYPMKRLGTLSFKSTILQYFLNIEFLEIGLLKLTNHFL